MKPIVGPLLRGTGVHPGHLYFLFLVIGLEHSSTAGGGSIGGWRPITMVTLATDVTLLATRITGHFPEVPFSHPVRRLRYCSSPWLIEGVSWVRLIGMVMSQHFFCIGEACSDAIGRGVHSVWVTHEAIEVTMGKPTGSSSSSKRNDACGGSSSMLIHSSVHVDVLFLTTHGSPLPLLVVAGHIELIHLLI